MEWVPSPLATVAAWVLMATFAWAAFAKILNPGPWRSAVVGFGFGGAAARSIAFAVPLAEAAIVVLFPFGRLQIAAAFTLTLVAGFSAAIVRTRVAGRRDKVPCGCFGGNRRRDYRLLLGRNAGLAVLAAVILLAPGRSSLALPSGTDLLPTALIVLAGFLLVWMTAQAASSMRRR